MEGDRRFYESFTLDVETGVGSDDEANPLVSLRWSDDGGHQWNDERVASMGVAGSYGQRVQWRRLGQSRDRVFEVSGTAPVKVALIDAHITVRQGRH